MASERALMAFMSDTYQEVERAQRAYPPLNSDHEAYAVLLEEVDEYWQEVKRKREDRDTNAMYRELVQVAAMAARAAVERLMEPPA